MWPQLLFVADAEKARREREAAQRAAREAALAKLAQERLVADRQGMLLEDEYAQAREVHDRTLVRRAGKPPSEAPFATLCPTPDPYFDLRSFVNPP